MNKKSVRKNLVKESLLDFEKLSATLKENTSAAVKTLLQESIRQGYMDILKESDDDDEYDVDEVPDTEVNDTEDVEGAPEDTSDDNSSDDASDDAGMEPNAEGDQAADAAEGDSDGAADGIDADAEGMDDVPADDVDADAEGDAEVAGGEADDLDAADGDGDDMSDMEQFATDGGYDLTQADDDTVVKVYKRLKDDDQIVITPMDGKVKIEDNDTGAEYLIDMGGDAADEMEEPLGDEGAEADYEADAMDESVIYEVALNEYDSNTGYDDGYQSKDVMTNDGMAEPSKNGRDWDKGVPKGTKKPWSGKNKQSDKPFNENEQVMDEDEQMVDEASTTNTPSSARRRNKSHQPTNPNHLPNNGHEISQGGQYKGHVTNEAVVKKLNAALAENKRIAEQNKKLTSYLLKFKGMIHEAAVTNYNLGQIIKLISENATTVAEKQNIINRFGNEADTVEKSDALYESISQQLKQNGRMNIMEERQMQAQSSEKINETKIYMSQDMMESLDLMHRICK